MLTGRPQPSPWAPRRPRRTWPGRASCSRPRPRSSWPPPSSAAAAGPARSWRLIQTAR